MHIGPSMKSSECRQDRQSYQGTLAIPVGPDMLIGSVLLEKGVVIWEGGCPFFSRRRTATRTTRLEVEGFDEYTAGTPSPAAI